MDANQFKPVVAPAPSRAALKAGLAKAKPVATECVTIVAEDGTSYDVEVRSVPAGVRWELEQHGTDPVTDKIKAGTFLPMLLAAACFDPASGERIWGDDEHGAIRDLDATVTRPLLAAALRLNGMAKESASGNSSAGAPAAGSAAASGSPES